MKILNETKKTVLATDAKVAKGFFDQIFGLLRESNPKTLIFNTRFGIHTLFLKIPIDVVILNNQKQVVKLKNALPPNSFFFWNPIYKTVIELPNTTIVQSQTTLNDILQIKCP